MADSLPPAPEPARAGVPRDHQWRPYGRGLLPVLPDDRAFAWIENHTFDTRTGAPPGVEDEWNVGRASELHATAWRILLIMFRTGLNLQWDILDAEQDRVEFEEPQVKRGTQAYRQGNALRFLRKTGDYFEQERTRVGRTSCVWMWLTDEARALLDYEAGLSDFDWVESDWDRLRELHDPHGIQRCHNLLCLLAARLARGRGFKAELIPEMSADQPQVDLQLTPPDGGEPIYVECESRAPQRYVRRQRKWERLTATQGYCAVITDRPEALEYLSREIRLAYRKPCVGTDLETLIQDPNVPFWPVDDRQNPHYREQINHWRRFKGLPPLDDD